MVTDNPRLQKALEQKRKAEEVIKKIKAKENSQQRKLDTRRKILLGVVLQGMIADGVISANIFDKALDNYLMVDKDRELLDAYFESHRPKDKKFKPSTASDMEKI
jgi:hypothetical protein